jgi:acetoin utilization deacetylase AcuC-like enzyme
MRTWYSEDHRLHFPQGELSGGELVTPFERPSRVEYVLRRLSERGFEPPRSSGPVDAPLLRVVHAEDYLGFLETAWREWRAEGFAGEAIAGNYPARRMQTVRPPRHIDGKVGYYALASDTAIMAGTWPAALASAGSAQAAAVEVADGARAAFALCRPPGHHASRDQFGGYCFINNAAVAAEAMLSRGAGRVAILDIDFHHGNGTQDIFWERADVFFASLHGDPIDAFPYFLGHADETGLGAGEGSTANYPMPPGTPWDQWGEALDEALVRIGAWGADALVVSLGVDAFENDPISFFKLTSEDFSRAGARISRSRLPTAFCLEGGYAVDEIGINVVNVLEGFEGG